MRLVTYHTDEGCRVAIVDTGRKWLHCVMFDPTELRVVDVPLEEARYMRDIESRPRIKHSPLVSTAKRWLHHAKTMGACALLEKAAAHESPNSEGPKQ